MPAKSPSPKGQSSKGQSSKGQSKGQSGKGSSKSRGDGAPTDKAKTIKAVVAVVALVATATWLIYYYDPFALRTPDPGPAPDAFIEQLPEPERQRTRERIERAQEQLDSGEEAPQTSGQ